MSDAGEVVYRRERDDVRHLVTRYIEVGRVRHTRLVSEIQVGVEVFQDTAFVPGDPDKVWDIRAHAYYLAAEHLLGVLAKVARRA